MVFFAIPLVLLLVGVVFAVYRPVITGAVAIIATVLVHMIADGAGSGALALLPHLWAAYAVLFASFVAFFARLVERKRNK